MNYNQFTKYFKDVKGWSSLNDPESLFSRLIQALIVPIAEFEEIVFEHHMDPLLTIYNQFFNYDRVRCCEENMDVDLLRVKADVSDASDAQGS